MPGAAPPAVFREIGAGLGVSAERARQLLQEALARLRQPAISHTLRSLLQRHTLADYATAEALTQGWLRQREGAVAAELTAVASRAQDAQFGAQCRRMPHVPVARGKMQDPGPAILERQVANGSIGHICHEHRKLPFIEVDAAAGEPSTRF